MRKIIKQKSEVSINLIFILVLIIGLLNVNVSGCYGVGGSTSWKEEVLLHDGSKIIIERFYNLGGKPTLDSHEQLDLDETVTFTIPGTNKRITWKTDFRDSKPEPNSLNLLALDIVKGTPYIAAYPAGCIAYNKWKRPNPPYIFFKYDGNAWKQIPLEEFPPEISKVNVIVGRPPAELQKPFYTIMQVNEQNQNLREEYRSIIRKPMSGVGCEELIYDGKYWQDISGLKRQPSLEACLDLCPKIGIKTEYCPCERLFKNNKKEK